jgi:anti-sigma factor RsiW
MSEHDCMFVREQVADTGHADDPRVSSHLSTCPDCQAEAARLERLVAWLALGSHIAPSDESDTRVRRLIMASPARPVLSPAVALGLAMAGFVALVSALVSPAVQTGGDGRAGAVLTLALATYLVLTTAASMPLLLVYRRRARQTLEEVAS